MATHAIEVSGQPEVTALMLGARNPQQVVREATRIATVLAQIITKQKLYQQTQGKRFVTVEGWVTLGAMCGATPHEVSVVEEEGVFIATVELRRLADGMVVGRASAECGAPDEVDTRGKPTWASRPRYARRSMALTRATS